MPNPEIEPSTLIPEIGDEVELTTHLENGRFVETFRGVLFSKNYSRPGRPGSFALIGTDGPSLGIKRYFKMDDPGLTVKRILRDVYVYVKGGMLVDVRSAAALRVTLCDGDDAEQMDRAQLKDYTADFEAGEQLASWF